MDKPLIYDMAYFILSKGITFLSISTKFSCINPMTSVIFYSVLFLLSSVDNSTWPCNKIYLIISYPD